jgi:hypothetical protein
MDMWMDTMDIMEFSVFVNCVHFGRWTQWTQCRTSNEDLEMAATPRIHELLDCYDYKSSELDNFFVMIL